MGVFIYSMILHVCSKNYPTCEDNSKELGSATNALGTTLLHICSPIMGLKQAVRRHHIASSPPVTSLWKAIWTQSAFQRSSRFRCMSKPSLTKVLRFSHYGIVTSSWHAGLDPNTPPKQHVQSTDHYQPPNQRVTARSIHELPAANEEPRSHSCTATIIAFTAITIFQ